MISNLSRTVKEEALKPEVVIQYAGNTAQVEVVVEKIKKLLQRTGVT